MGMMGGMKRESAAGFRWVVLGVLMVMTAASAWAGSQDNPRLSLPHSHLGLDPDSPAFLVGYVGTGGAFSNSNGQFGYGGAVVFHPDYAANFLDFLRQWNAGLVLQVDYQELYTHYRIRSGDFILRKYLGAVDQATRHWVPYVSAGIGMSEISFHEGDGRGTETGWAPLAAFGCEGTFGGRYLVDFRGQYRQYKRHGHDYIDWTARLGLGVTLPW